jgi:hypothetical protein
LDAFAFQVFTTAGHGLAAGYVRQRLRRQVQWQLGEPPLLSFVGLDMACQVVPTAWIFIVANRRRAMS